MTTSRNSVSGFPDLTDSPVLIIGFGVAGIVQCHTFVANGFTNVQVVEAGDSFGGVWNLQNQYPGLQAQNTKDNFEFPEMRHDPNNYDDFPTQEQVQAYLGEYIEKFDLKKYVQFNTRVQTVRRRYAAEVNAANPKYKFLVTFDQRVQGSFEQTFDFVVCATGFTSVPHIPSCLEAPPSNITVLHSSQIRQQVNKTPTFGQGKRIAVVGSGKSALDAATWAVSAGAESVDLIMSRVPFAVPQCQHASGDKEKGMLEFNRIFSRALSWLIPCDPESVRVRGVLPILNYFFQSTRLGKAICNSIWTQKFQEFASISNAPPELVHSKSEKYIENSRHMCVYPRFFVSLVNEGKIRLVLGAKATGFSETGRVVVVTRKPNNDEHQEKTNEDSTKHYDIVVCATGWKSSLGFLSQEIQDQLYNEHGQMQLYRAACCPFVKQMAFIGFHLTINSMLCSALAARWITEQAKGSSGCLAQPMDDEAVLRAMERPKFIPLLFL